MSQRKIIHIDMDAFYASVEQRDRPEYRGRPIAVGYDGPRGVVATASYEARPYGVHSALSSVLAKRLCPELIFVPARFDVYKAVSRQIRAIFGEYTELVEPLSLDEAFLDVSHVRSATLVAREIKARILAETGLTASAGISVNKMLAKIASDYRKPDGLFTIPPERIEEFVAGLPVERFFGIGEVTAEKMHRLGIRTGADLRLWNEAALVQQFGKAGHSYYGYARGIDEREVTPNRVRKSLGAETTFAEDTDDRERLRLELSAVREEVRKYNTRAEIVECNHTPKVLKDVWSREEFPLEWLSEKTVCTLSGIASPKGFENSLRHLGAKVVWCERYADHHRYDASEVLYALNRTADMGADALVTTEKDAVRFPRFETTPVRCLYLRIAIEILAGGESFTQIINRICFRKSGEGAR